MLKLPFIVRNYKPEWTQVIQLIESREQMRLVPLPASFGGYFLSYCHREVKSKRLSYWRNQGLAFMDVEASEIWDLGNQRGRHCMQKEP